jgi:tetratricopeptide (TPR) repeat protein
MRRGDEKRAEEEAKLALPTAHDPTDALMLLAGLERERGNLKGALAYLDQALVASERGTGTHPGLHAQRGDILARLGRNDEAEREFRTEIAKTPGAPGAYASLVMLLATERRFDEATKVVLSAAQNAPQPQTFVMLAETLAAIGDERGALYWSYQGLQRYPNDPDLKRLPAKVRKFAPQLRSRLQK